MDMLNLNPKQDNKCMTLNAYNGTGGNNMPLILDVVKETSMSKEIYAKGLVTKGNGDAFLSDNKHMSLGCGGGQAGQGYPCILTENKTELPKGYDIYNMAETGNVGRCLSTSGGGLNVVRLNDQGGKNMSISENITATLRAQEHGHQPCVEQTMVVRRLTPLECERLQNFPDHWTDIGEWTDSKGKLHKDADSPRYKALGNSIALPFWQWMAKRMTKILKKDGVENPTMASLFSGIGGFELVFARAGAKALWNSEIEDFPEAVTKIHFGDDDNEGDYERYL